jgi:hypothetical protein
MTAVDAGLDHGYVCYTRGCRCQPCRAAKAAYVRTRRAAAAALAAEVGHHSYVLVADEITHGTRFAYEERGCRCDPCTTVKRAQWRSEYRPSPNSRPRHADSL